jgi:hypothetical protein
LDRTYRNNSHLLGDDAELGPSRHVAYYDAASLYPSSGDHFAQRELCRRALPPPPPLGGWAAPPVGGGLFEKIFFKSGFFCF